MRNDEFPTARTSDPRDIDRLVRRYAGFAVTLSRDYYLPGSDRDDVNQEALIGLYHAIEAYDGHGRFLSFVELVVRRRLMTSVRLANGLKHRPLTQAARTVTHDDGDTVDILETVTSPRARDPHLVAVDNERIRELAARIAALTPTERTALLGVANGLTYREIPLDHRQIDNAVQRARRKLAA